MTSLAAQHLRACQGFSRVVSHVGDRWTAPSPCDGWDAREVVEHVVGLHDALVLRPLGAKPSRPHDDTATRWALTVSALAGALDELDESSCAALEAASGMAPARLLPIVMTEVLVHGWDLAAAVGADRDLDAALCAAAVATVTAGAAALAASGRYAPPRPVPDGADDATRLLCLLGRDPGWTPAA